MRPGAAAKSLHLLKLGWFMVIAHIIWFAHKSFDDKCDHPLSEAPKIGTSFAQHNDVEKSTKSVTSNVIQVAICVMVTASGMHGDVDEDLARTMDGASTLRRSVLNVYNLSEEANMQRVQRTVGLRPYNQNSEESAKWMQSQNEIVSVYQSSHLGLDQVVEFRFIAMVDDNINKRWLRVLGAHGFEVWKTRTPLESTEIRNNFTAEEISKNGAVGISELIKLEGLRMKGFSSVIFVDCDVMFHRRFDELIFMEENLGWTHGGWESEKMNGGFLVFSPDHQASTHHMDQMIEILREGNFSGSGWRASGIGWTYGGMTVQGILPYYYFIHAHKEQALLAGQMNMHLPLAHREIDRCKYNNMDQLDKCKSIPFESVISNHFSGNCGKPWHCRDNGISLCDKFRNEFVKRYKEVVCDLARTHIGLNSSKAVDFVQNVGGDQLCLGGEFVSVSALLYKMI